MRWIIGWRSAGSRRGVWLAACAALIGTALQITSIGQAVSPAQATVENVRFEPMAGGLVAITYDLIAQDPAATFQIVLEISQDAGKTFTMKPTSVSGDIGPAIRPGPGKRIVWEAGRDVEMLVMDQFRFNVRAVSAAVPRGNGRLSVQTTPPGAQVVIDGTPRGRTPLELADLSLGSHQVTVALAGYLENSRSVEVTASSTARVEIALTRGQPTPSPTTSTPSRSGGGGGATKWILIGGGAAGAAGAALALSGGGDSGGSGATGGGPPPPPPPTATIVTGTIAVSPAGTAIQSVTQVTLTLNGWDERSGSPLTFAWEFGDGTSLAAVAGQTTVVRAYQSAGAFTARATLRNARGETASTTASVPVASLSGTWAATFGSNFGATLTLTQSATQLTGTQNPISNTVGVGPISGSVNASRAITLRTPPTPGLSDIVWSGTVDSTGNRITGTVSGYTGGPFNFTMDRR